MPLTLKLKESRGSTRLKDTIWGYGHGRVFILLIGVVGKTLVLLLLVTVCMFWVGKVSSSNGLHVGFGGMWNVSQKQSGLTLFTTNGKKLQTCSKKEAVPLVWPLKERFLLQEDRLGTNNCIHVKCTRFLQTNSSLSET